MKKKIVIIVCVIVLISACIIGGMMYLKNKEEIETDNSIISGDMINKDGIDYIDPEEDFVINGLISGEILNEYAPVQEIRLEENKIKEYLWNMKAEGLENILIDSGDTEFLYAEHGVGEVVNRVYKITGVSEGETILRFTASYRQRSQESLVKSQTIIYKISVNADKQVAITEEIRFIPTENYNGHNH